ncbi:MAG: methyltransferase domain-containing protein [Bacteriovoracaceae bacterium]|jgi:hypothetical protein|nr:methyltransferase domain-containing protein [Bacteriovoracaceae bacterium]
MRKRLTAQVTQINELIRKSDFFIPAIDQDDRQHATHVDKVLGFNIAKIEQKLLGKYRAFFKKSDNANRKNHYQGTQTWIGLHPQVLLTPYAEISHFLSLFKKYDPKTIVDLGAGYGRVGIVMNALLPKASFIGYEILDVRVKEAQRVFEKYGLENCEMRSQNILDKSFEMPKADVYFIYDFSDPLDLRIILKRLSEKLSTQRFFIVARGDGIRSLIQLKFPEFWAVHGAIHKKQWSIYSSYCDLD